MSDDTHELDARGAAEFGGVAYEDLLSSIDVAVVLYDDSGRIQAANRAARAMWADAGVTVSDSGRFSEGLEYVDESGEPLAVVDAPPLRALRSGEAILNAVTGLAMPDGRTRWHQVSAVPIFDRTTGRVKAVICTVTEITEFRNAQEELRSSEQRFRALAEHSSDVMYRVSIGPSARVEFVNPAFEAMFGYTPEELTSGAVVLLDVLHEDDRGLITRLIEVDPSGQSSVNLRMRHRDGHIIWTQHQVAGVHDASHAIVAYEGVVRDVTTSIERETELSHRALHDPLTQLPNRVLLFDRLENALARTLRQHGYLAALYIDLDCFKIVNDNFGHRVGDRVLQAVARRLDIALRPSDTVARLGGDEFAAVLPDLHSPGEAVEIAHRLLHSLSEPVDLVGGAAVVSASIGIAVAGGSDDDLSASDLLGRADAAMYEAKRAGRGRVEMFRSAGRAGRAPEAD